MNELPENIKKLINQRNYYRHKYQNRHIYEYKQLYNQLNNVIKNAIHEWRNDTWNNKLKKLNTSDNSLWKLIKKLT